MTGRPSEVFCFPVDHENLAHLPVELRIFPFDVVGDLVGFQGLTLQYPVNGRLGRFGKAGMARSFGPAPDIGRQRASGPEFRRHPQILGRGAGQGDHPGLGVRRNDRIAGTMVEIGQSGLVPHRQRLVDAFVDGLSIHSDISGNVLDRHSTRIGQENFSPLDLPQGSFSG